MCRLPAIANRDAIEAGGLHTGIFGLVEVPGMRPPADQNGCDDSMCDSSIDNDCCAPSGSADQAICKGGLEIGHRGAMQWLYRGQVFMLSENSGLSLPSG